MASVRKAPDPGKLVLMLMQNSLVKYWTSAEASLKKGAMSCNIYLLKMLMRVSPQVGSHVKEDAKKLGLQWKENIKAAEHLENHLEIAGFLLFVVTYGLISTLNGDEIVKLLERLSQHKEAFESLLMHGFLDKILGKLLENLLSVCCGVTLTNTFIYILLCYFCFLQYIIFSLQAFCKHECCSSGN